MKIIRIIFLLCSCMVSCKNNSDVIRPDINNTEWYEVEKVDKGFVFTCDDIQRRIIINSENSISLILYEKSSFELSKIIETKAGYELNFKNMSWKYIVKWIDKEKGIAKWEYTFKGKVDDDFSYYAVLKANKNFSYIKKPNCEKDKNDESNNYNIYCKFDALSEDFSYLITGVSIDEGSYEIKIQVTNKHNLKSQIIEFSPNLWDNEFKCRGISYLGQTKTDENLENPNNFIVSDYNFDNLEDFAILYDIGGSSGPLYSYYIQNNDGTFTEDKKFPLFQSVFPVEIDNINKNITTKSIIGCCKIQTSIYQLVNNIKWNTITSEEEIK